MNWGSFLIGWMGAASITVLIQNFMIANLHRRMKIMEFWRTRVMPLKMEIDDGKQ